MYPFIFNRSPVIQPVSSNVRHLSTFLHILASPGYAPGTIAVNLHGWKEDSMLVKRIAASTIYLQPFPSNPTRKFKRLPFKHIFAHFGLPWVRPWDNRDEFHTDRKRIQCMWNASLHMPIYLQPFLRYSKLLVENCDIFIPHLCLAAPQGVTPSAFREDV